MDLTPDNITAFMLGLKTRIATFSVQRQINEYPQEAMLAIMPGVTLQQLWSTLGSAEGALRMIASLVVLLGLVSMIALLVATLQERRREMAILRAVGARPRDIAWLLLFEAGLVTVVSCALALLVVSAASWLARGWVLDHFGLAINRVAPSAVEWGWLGCVLLAGVLAGIVPALLAYRRTLADGLSPEL
jgi:putative ABC transport system permease protein